MRARALHSSLPRGDRKTAPTAALPTAPAPDPDPFPPTRPTDHRPRPCHRPVRSPRPCRHSHRPHLATAPGSSASIKVASLRKPTRS